jgi:hypothetical protein
VRVLLLAVLLFTLACGAPDGPTADPSEDEPASGALGALRDSDRGTYRVSLRPSDGEIPLHRFHSWIFHVETRDGELFPPARLDVDGGMPQHAHGFETQPRVSRPLGDGDFLVEGVKFHMPGAWVIRFEVVGAGSGDMATFHVQVDP